MRAWVQGGPAAAVTHEGSFRHRHHPGQSTPPVLNPAKQVTTHSISLQGHGGGGRGKPCSSDSRVGLGPFPRCPRVRAMAPGCQAQASAQLLVDAPAALGVVATLLCRWRQGSCGCCWSQVTQQVGIRLNPSALKGLALAPARLSVTTQGAHGEPLLPRGPPKSRCPELPSELGRSHLANKKDMPSFVRTVDFSKGIIVKYMCVPCSVGDD